MPNKGAMVYDGNKGGKIRLLIYLFYMHIYLNASYTHTHIYIYVSYAFMYRRAYIRTYTCMDEHRRRDYKSDLAGLRQQSSCSKDEGG